MEFISGRSFTNKQHKQFLQANDKLYECMKLSTENIRTHQKRENRKQKTSSLNTEMIRQAHKIMVDGEDILVGEYRKSPAFAGYHVFAPANLTERYMEDAIFRFHEKG